MTINQSFQNWTLITDEPGEELVFEHEDPDTGQKDRFVFTEEAGLGSETNPFEDGYGKQLNLTDTTTVTVSVPSDYDTIQDAIDALEQRYRPRGVEFVINIETGHSITDGFDLQNGYYGNFRITSDDSTVPVDATHDSGDLFVAEENCTAPILDCLIDGQSNIGSGIRLEYNCSMYVTTGSGVQNATGDGAVIRHSSFLVAISTDFSGAGLKGLDVYRTSHAVVDGSNFSDAGSDCIRCVRASLVTAEAVTATNAGRDALHCTRSGRINAEQSADLQNATNNGVTTDRNGEVNCREADVRGAGNNAVDAGRGGKINASETTLSDGANPVSNHAIRAATGGMVTALSTTATDCGARGIEATDGGIVTANGGNFNNATSQALFGENGAMVNLASATLNNSGSNGVFVQGGTKLNLQDASVQDSNFTDMRVETGSILNIEGCTTTGSTGTEPSAGDVSISLNTVTGNGIVFAVNSIA